MNDNDLNGSSLPEPCIIVIFGVTGDLARRELMPALYELRCRNLLPEPCAIVGFARRDWSDDKFREEMRAAVSESACKLVHWEELARRMYYVRGNFDDDAGSSYAALRERIGAVRDELGIPEHVLMHLSTPPGFYGTIAERLGAAALAQSENGWRRVIIEKPFGQDAESARKLEATFHEVFSEEQIFRIDHFLGKETVQNMLAFRFANPAFEPIWNHHYIDHIRITAAESGGIGTRGSFYEKNGVVRDMLQNHLLQLLCMVAIEPPVSYSAASLRTETLKAIESIRAVDLERDCVLGQYGAGEIGGAQVRAYREEADVAGDSTTPTFVAAKLVLENWRWAGTPVYLRTGKRLAQKLTEVTVQFKRTPHQIFEATEEHAARGNTLTFRLAPQAGIHHAFLAKQPGPNIRLQSVDFDFCYSSAFGIERPPGAYEWLLHDAMRGDQTLFPRADWILSAWQLVDPIVEKWASAPRADLPNYEAGSWGPDAAEQLLRRDRRRWHAGPSTSQQA
jgi:glucose-6-phosphate 1-dehydrogenase